MSATFYPSPAHEQFFTTYGQSISYKKNNYLVRPEDESPWVFYLKSGLVSVSFSFTDGSERLIGFFTPGMVFAQSGSFFQDAGGGLEYIATTNSDTYRLRRADFLAQLDHDQAFSADYMQLLLRNQIYLIERIVYQGESGMRNKCLRWLLFMVKYYGEPAERGGIVLGVPLTQEIIANFLHATRESVSKVLKELVAKDWIVIENKCITIKDITALEKALE